MICAARTCGGGCKILGIDWATPAEVAGTGTFKEGWTLAWRPELSVRLVEASVWGTTVPAAAAGALVDRADSLADCTAAIADCITADLPAVMGELLHRLDRFAADTADVTGAADGTAGPGARPALRHRPRDRHRCDRRRRAGRAHPDLRRSGPRPSAASTTTRPGRSRFRWSAPMRSCRCCRRARPEPAGTRRWSWPGSAATCRRCWAAALPDC